MKPGTNGPDQSDHGRWRKRSGKLAQITVDVWRPKERLSAWRAALSMSRALTTRSWKQKSHFAWIDHKYLEETLRGSIHFVEASLVCNAALGKSKRCAGAVQLPLSDWCSTHPTLTYRNRQKPCAGAPAFAHGGRAGATHICSGRRARSRSRKRANNAGHKS